jgi:uncharacterized Zn finger protein (UPF0148 family)
MVRTIDDKDATIAHLQKIVKMMESYSVNGATVCSICGGTATAEYRELLEQLQDREIEIKKLKYEVAILIEREQKQTEAFLVEIGKYNGNGTNPNGTTSNLNSMGNSPDETLDRSTKSPDMYL